MVLFKRKQVQYLTPSLLIPEDAEVWSIEETEEVFTSYEEYLRRNDFYRQRRFICEITGHSGLTFREALRSEKEASGEVDDAFPEPLREPILRKVQFSQVSRIDYLVDTIFDAFKRDFYPGESVTITLGETRLTGQIKAKSKFPELKRSNGEVERSAFARYFCHIDQQPGNEALLDADHISRERKVFTKQRLRSFLKNSATRDAWAGAPWLVKQKLAEDYRIGTEIPLELTQEFQARIRKNTVTNGKKGEDSEGSFLNFQAYGPQGAPQYQLLKPRGRKANVEDEQAQLQYAQYLQYHHSGANPPLQVPPGFVGYQPLHPGANGFHPIAAKGQQKPAAPPPPKFPIEDLEVPPLRDGTHRPPLKFLSEQTPTAGQISDGAGSGIVMESVGLLLETWNTLNVYCEVYQLDSFTFDDYVEALQFRDAEVQCELLVEIHCAVLKKLVNDVNDKNGQVQITLPHQVDSDEEESMAAESHHVSPTPEPEVVKPPARSTRSSLIKSEAAELREATIGLSLEDTKIHRAAEMDRGYDWKTRLRKRELQDGQWVIIIVGLLNQLAGNDKMARYCNEILAHLAPLDKEPTTETAFARYMSLDINHRINILQIICMTSLETKAIKQYMEECSLQMTEHRKEKNDIKRKWRAAVDDLRQLNEDRKALQPERASVSPPPEVEDIEDRKMEVDEEDEVEDEDEEEEVAASEDAAESEDEAPHQGRSLRRANDRAAARKTKAEEEKERKAIAAAEKAKRPSKEEKKYEKVLAKIELAKEQIKYYEEEIATVENDLRENDCPRTRCLGKDRFWNRYYWMERNAMPFAGLPDSSTAHAGYANGCLWVQGPDDLERSGFIELDEAENAQYSRAFQLTVPQRKVAEEGETHVFTARQWGYYDDTDKLDMLIGWLDNRGVREVKLRKELSQQRENISDHMRRRQEYLAKDEDNKSESSEPTTRVSTRTKIYGNPTTHRCLAWRNTTAINEIGHLHCQPRPPTYKKQRGVAVKKAQVVEPEGELGPRQTRGANRQTSGSGKGAARTSNRVPTRQGSRYDF